MNFFEEVVFPWVQSREGELSLDPHDSGNWTGGKVDAGELRGTKYGISAAAYPTLDIAGLSYDDAAEIAERDYWQRIHGYDMPEPLALCVFDFAYNSGVHEAVVTLQKSLGVTADGIVGIQTQIACDQVDPRLATREFTRCRIAAYQQMLQYFRYGKGWVARAEATRDKALTLANSGPPS